MSADHFVPQFYLSSFTSGPAKDFWCADLHHNFVRLSTPKRVAAIEDYYAICAAETLKTLEGVYAQYETRAAPVFKKLAVSPDPSEATDQEMLVFFHFLILQILRTPTGFLALEPMLRSYLSTQLLQRPRVQEAIRALPAHERIAAQSLTRNYGISTPLEPSLVRIAVVLGAENMTIEMAQQPSRWFFVTPVLDDDEYITCDAPAFYTVTTKQPHQGHFLMPLSPRRMLVVCRRESCMDHAIHNIQPAIANIHIADSALRQIFARRKSDAEAAYRLRTAPYRFVPA